MIHTKIVIHSIFITLITLPLSSSANSDLGYSDSFVVRCSCNTQEERLKLENDEIVLGAGNYVWAAHMNAQHVCGNAVTERVNAKGFNYTLVKGKVFNCQTIAEPAVMDPVK